MSEDEAPERPYFWEAVRGPVRVRLEVAGGEGLRDVLLYGSLVQLTMALTLNLRKYGAPYGLRAGVILNEAIDELQKLQGHLDAASGGLKQ